MQDKEACDGCYCHAMSSRLWMLALAIVFNGLISSCATYEKVVLYCASDHFVTHRSPLVAVPAFTGKVIGVAAGLPLDFPTYVLGKMMLGGPERQAGETKEEYRKKYRDYIKKPENNPHWLFAPSFILGFAGEEMMGFPCWALSGWWWPASDYSFLFGNVKKTKSEPTEKKDIKPDQ